MFVGKKTDRKKERYLLNIPKNQKEPQKLYTAREYQISFQGPNVKHVGYLTEQWREMVSLLGNTEIIFEFHTDVRANELTNYFTTINA